MKKYRAFFWRTNGGYEVTRTIEANTPDEAIRKAKALQATYSSLALTSVEEA